MPDEISAFEHWLRAVGLPLHFPRLEAVEFVSPAQSGVVDLDDRFYFGQPHEELVEAAIQSLAQPALANLVPDGHGVTTLARYVYHRSTAEASRRNLIPVSLRLEDLLAMNDIEQLEEQHKVRVPVGARRADRHLRLLNLAAARPDNEDEREDTAATAFRSISVPGVEDALSEAIQTSIVRSLLSEPWERIIGRPMYADLISANLTAPEELESRRRTLSQLLADGGDPQAVFSSMATKLTHPWTELMPELYAHANVKLSVQLDLSPSPIGRYYVEDEGERLTVAYTDALRDFAAAVKNVSQLSRSTVESATGSGYMNRAVFLSSAAWDAYESQVSERLERSDFPPYSALDVFTILAVHFPRSTGGKKERKDELAAVLDSSLIQYSADRALSTMIEELSRRLRDLSMPEVRFQLTETYKGIWGPARGFSEFEEQLSDINKRLDLVDSRLHTLEYEDGSSR